MFSSKTVFLVISGTAKEPVYNLYTGINNVPSLVGTTGATAYVVKNSTTDIAEFVVVKNATGGATATTNTYFVLGSSVAKTTDVNEGEYYVYNAIVNGEVTTVKSAEQITAGNYKFVTSVSINDKGVITAYGTAVETKSATGTNVYDSELGLVKFTSGTNAGSFTVTADCAVYTIEDGVITKGGVDSIGTDANDTVIYTVKDGVVTNIYVTVVPAT